MKKIKLFALAVLAMLGTNAMDAAPVEATIGIWKISYPADDLNSGQIVGFKNDITAAEVATLTIPATLLDSDNGGKTVKIKSIKEGFLATSAFKTNIQTIDMTEATNLETIGNNAFEGATGLTTVKFGPKLTTSGSTYGIGAAAFKGCSKLETVTFATAASGITDQSIGQGAFEGTAITELDLTNAKVVTLNQLFTTTSGSPAVTTKNKKLTTVKLPATLTTIAAGAFNSCMVLETIEWATSTTGITINANAFENCIFLEELELPANVEAIAANALDGSSVTTLTINSNATAGKPTIGAIGGDDLTSIIVKGAFKGAFGDGTHGVSSTITSLTFKGTVAADAIKAASLASATKLATITFEGNLAAGAVAAGALGTGSTSYAGSALGTGKMLTISYNPTEAAATKVVSIATDAIATGTDATPGIAKLSTATWYKAWLESNSGKPVKIDISADAATKNIEVANNGTGKYYYGTLIASGNYKIAAAQNGGKVMVYAAYIDQIVNDDKTVDNQVYMDQLHIYEGCYWIPNGSNVVIKSTTSDPVVAEAVATLTHNSTHYNNATTPADLNQIGATTEDLFGKELMDTDASKDFYFLAPFADYGFLWSTFLPTRELPKGTFYLSVAKAPSSARVSVIWLDGSEEDQTTAIQSVKNVAEDGVIYNMAGQQVDANYKGVVIKNGKKMIQK